MLYENRQAIEEKILGLYPLDIEFRRFLSNDILANNIRETAFLLWQNVVDSMGS